jgi:hypothetical protein
VINLIDVRKLLSNPLQDDGLETQIEWISESDGDGTCSSLDRK